MHIFLLPYRLSALICTLLLCYQGTLHAQTKGYDLPFSYSFYTQPIFQNAAENWDHESVIIDTKFHSYLGYFSNLNQFAAAFRYPLKSTRSLGINFMQENESDFFGRTRMYATYSEKIPISKSATITLGGQIGGVQFLIEPQGFSAGGQDMTIDIGFGFLLEVDDLKIGAAMQQIPNPTLQPIVAEFVMERFYEVYAKYKINLPAKWSYQPELRTRIMTTEYVAVLSNELQRADAYGIDLSYYHEYGASVSGFYNYRTPSQTTQLRVFFTFFQPFNSTLENIDAQQYETGLAVLFGKKRQTEP